MIGSIVMLIVALLLCLVGQPWIALACLLVYHHLDRKERGR